MNNISTGVKVDLGRGSPIWCGYKEPKDKNKVGCICNFHYLSSPKQDEMLCGYLLLFVCFISICNFVIDG